jgi:hypothetical protein
MLFFLLVELACSGQTENESGVCTVMLRYYAEIMKTCNSSWLGIANPVNASLVLYKLVGFSSITPGLHRNSTNRLRRNTFDSNNSASSAPLCLSNKTLGK